MTVDRAVQAKGRKLSSGPGWRSQGHTQGSEGRKGEEERREGGRQGGKKELRGKMFVRRRLPCQGPVAVQNVKC